MTTITVEVPDHLANEVNQARERLPEILALGLNRLAITPAAVYRYLVNFLANNPTPTEIVAFRPTQEMESRLRTLLERSREGRLSIAEVQELEEYEQIEHFIIMLKSGHLRWLADLG